MQQQAPDNDVNNFQNERVDRENNLKEESTESSSEVDNVNETSSSLTSVGATVAEALQNLLSWSSSSSHGYCGSVYSHPITINACCHIFNVTRHRDIKKTTSMAP
jgi:hypothetical protein